MQLVCVGASLERSFARILDAERRHDRHHLTRHTVLFRLDDHAPEPRVDRQLGELPADLRDGVVGTYRVQFAQQVEAIFDAAGVGWLQERERFDVAQSKGDHLQDHGCQVRAQNLGLGVFRAAHIVVFRVQPDRDAIARAPGATRTLIRGCLADRLDRQPLNFCTHAVAGDARQPRVDDVADAGNREARLGDVRGEHDAAANPGHRRRSEHLVLIGGAQAAIEGKHFGVRHPPPKRVFGVADLVLSAEKDEHVAGRLAGELVESGGDALDRVEVCFDGFSGGGWPAP